MAVGAALKQKIIDLGLQQWLDAWENAGLHLPENSREFFAFANANSGAITAAHPNALDSLFSGLQNAIVETMSRTVSTAWVDAVRQGETPAEDVTHIPAQKAIMNNVGVRVLKDASSKKERWVFKNNVLVQIPTADQATFGTFDNRVDIKWTSDSANTGNVAMDVRFIRVSGANIDEVQTLDLGSPTAGVFTVSFSGQTTAGIAYNATATTFQTAFEALSTVGTGNATITGNAGGPYTITFTGTLSGTDVAAITVDSSGLTGGTIVITETVKGIAGNAIPSTWSQVVSMNPTYSGDKQVYETRFGPGGLLGTFDVGDLLIAEISRDSSDSVADTLSADIGIIEARVV